MNDHLVFDSQQLRLTSIDIENDSPILARWSAKLEIARRFRDREPIRPLAEFEVRKVLEEWNKDEGRPNRNYVFALRPQADERLVGYVRISQVMWVHGAARFDLVIGEADDWALFADEALRMGLRYAFEEMNLFRVTVAVEEYNESSRALYTAAQFFLEVRQRQEVFYEGRYWDRLLFGMLRPEWMAYYQQGLGVAA